MPHARQHIIDKSCRQILLVYHIGRKIMAHGPHPAHWCQLRFLQLVQQTCHEWLSTLFRWLHLCYIHALTIIRIEISQCLAHNGWLPTSSNNLDISSVKGVFFNGMVKLWLKSCKLDVQPSKHIQELCVALYAKSSPTPGIAVRNCRVWDLRFKSYDGQLRVHCKKHCKTPTAHLYYNAQDDSAFYPPWDGKNKYQIPTFGLNNTTWWHR